MTKKDFQVIADAIKDGAPYFKSNSDHAAFASDMAKHLANTNPRFDRVRFIRACQPSWTIGASGRKESVWDGYAIPATN